VSTLWVPIQKIERQVCIGITGAFLHLVKHSNSEDPRIPAATLITSLVIFRSFINRVRSPIAIVFFWKLIKILNGSLSDYIPRSESLFIKSRPRDFRDWLRTETIESRVKTETREAAVVTRSPAYGKWYQRRPLFSGKSRDSGFRARNCTRMRSESTAMVRAYVENICQSLSFLIINY